jgi:hypothetical protein
MLKITNIVKEIFRVFFVISVISFIIMGISNHNQCNEIMNYETYTNISIATDIERCYLKMMSMLENLIKDYFFTFRYCWTQIMNSFVIMVDGYYVLLQVLIVSFMKWPDNLICSIAAIILLYLVKCIINDIFDKKIK